MNQRVVVEGTALEGAYAEFRQSRKQIGDVGGLRGHFGRKQAGG